MLNLILLLTILFLMLLFKLKTNIWLNSFLKKPKNRKLLILSPILPLSNVRYTTFTLLLLYYYFYCYYSVFNIDFYYVDYGRKGDIPMFGVLAEEIVESNIKVDNRLMNYILETSFKYKKSKIGVILFDMFCK